MLDEIKALRSANVDILISLLTPEEVVELNLEKEADYCQYQEITYISFPIPDRSTPPFSEKTFPFIEQLHRQLSAGRHIAVHCRQGLGRAALVAASVLVLAGFSSKQAFDLLSSARGCPVPETEKQQAWVVAFSQYYNSSHTHPQ